jgi:YgiT-type zinc finger domain-containing protein
MHILEKGQLCPTCQKDELDEIREDLIFTYKMNKRVFQNEKVFKCELCGYEGLTKMSIQKIEKELIDFRRDIDGLLTSVQLKQIREELERKLQGGNMSILGPDDLREGNNERYFLREECFSCISFHSKERLYTGNIINISLGGAFVQSLDPFPVGQTLTVVIPFTHKAETVKRTGKVVWNSSEGFGIEFKRPND